MASWYSPRLCDWPAPRNGSSARDVAAISDCSPMPSHCPSQSPVRSNRSSDQLPSSVWWRPSQRKPAATAASVKTEPPSSSTMSVRIRGSRPSSIRADAGVFTASTTFARSGRPFAASRGSVNSSAARSAASCVDPALLDRVASRFSRHVDGMTGAFADGCASLRATIGVESRLCKNIQRA